MKNQRFLFSILLGLLCSNMALAESWQISYSLEYPQGVEGFVADLAEGTFYSINEPGNIAPQNWTATSLVENVEGSGADAGDRARAMLSESQERVLVLWQAEQCKGLELGDFMQCQFSAMDSGQVVELRRENVTLRNAGIRSIQNESGFTCTNDWSYNGQHGLSSCPY